MMDLDISFENSPWDSFRMTLQSGDTVSAADLLTLLEGESEAAFEEALEDLETGCMVLSLADLPKAPGTGEAALRLRQEIQLVSKGLDPSALGESDPLRLYLEEIAGAPETGDEAALAEKCAAGDEKAMEKLTNLGLKRVVELAGEHVGYGVLLLDLIQEGSLGLWQAVRGYHGGDYARHRDRWVRFYMAKAITLQARASGVGQKLRTALEDYRAVDERLLSELGRNPTIEEIALELHMQSEEAAAIQKMLDNARLLAQAKKQPEPEEETEEAEQSVENTALFQMRQRVLDMLSGLSETDAKLLTLRFGLEGGMPLSPEDTGRRLGLTPDEVLAREFAALAKLRNQ